MIDNCEWCGKFVPDDYSNAAMNYLCRKCEETLEAETAENNTGIGYGQFTAADDNECRHCIRKWPMTEMVYNAVYGDRK